MAVTYKYQYIYNGTTYYDSWSVRRTIENTENKRFGPEPEQEEQREEFWQQHNVTYICTEYVVPEPDPAELLEAARDSKLNALENWFNEYRASSHTFIKSSLGFRANSNITAFNNVDGLIGLAGVPSFAPDGLITFMDFEDQPHQLSAGMLTTLKNEISAAASMAYQAKWKYRETILAATDEQTLKEIVFNFEPVDFTNDLSKKATDASAS